MDIKSAKYIKHKTIEGVVTDQYNSIVAVINGEELHVPFNPKNAHYQEIMRQVKEGTLTIQDAD